MAWDAGLVAVSLAAGGALSVAAAALFASRRDWTSRLGAPALLAASIAALHSAGTSAVTITPFPGPATGAGGLGGDWLPAATVGAMRVVLSAAAAALWQDRVELRRSSREMRAARDRAEAASRDESRFLAKMSHELRTPLNGVLGLAQTLQDTPLDDDRREPVRIILSSGDALVGIVDRIREAARADAEGIVLDPAPFDLAALVDEVVRLMAGRPAPRASGRRRRSPPTCRRAWSATPRASARSR